MFVIREWIFKEIIRILFCQSIHSDYFILFQLSSWKFLTNCDWRIGFPLNTRAYQLLIKLVWLIICLHHWIITNSLSFISKGYFQFLLKIKWDWCMAPMLSLNFLFVIKCLETCYNNGLTTYRNKKRVITKQLVCVMVVLSSSSYI